MPDKYHAMSVTAHLDQLLSFEASLTSFHFHNQTQLSLHAFAYMLACTISHVEGKSGSKG